MSCSFGEKFKVTVFGQSHSEMLGVVIDGVEAGVRLDMEKIKHFMSRRSPSDDVASTKRKETDAFEIVSGVVDSITCGAPICALIKNCDINSSDYEKIKNIPRPSHADFAAYMKHNGFNDYRGGGNFSGRMTAPFCFAGAVAIQLLEEKNIHIGAHIKSIADVVDESFDFVNVNVEVLKTLVSKSFPVINDEIGEEMKKVISSARENEDSVGGKIECAVVGMPVGVGEPIFDGLESEISHAVFSVPAIKGIEFGSTKSYGSENNDNFIISDGKIVTETNNHGGILGGLSSGMPIVFDVTVKPTPSIGKVQRSVNLDNMQETELKISGRHDACILPRIVPCIEAATAIAIINLL